MQDMAMSRMKKRELQHDDYGIVVGTPEYCTDYQYSGTPSESGKYRLGGTCHA